VDDVPATIRAVRGRPTARWAGEADVSAVAALLAEFQDVFEEGRPDDHALRLGVRRLMEGGDAEFFLAGEPPVGIALARFRWSLMLQCEDAYLEDLYVRASHRRRGYGRALLEAVFERIRERGGVYVELGASANNTEAVAFYQALGFTDRAGSANGPPTRVYARWVAEPPLWQRGAWPL
jgi:ribosomal protein S18 acetylase RimI-like enzyme